MHPCIPCSVVLTEVLPCELTDLAAPPYGVHASRGGASMLALLLGLGGQRAGAQQQERCDRGQSASASSSRVETEEMEEEHLASVPCPARARVGWSDGGLRIGEESVG
jgi:hypothetical protein